MFKFFNRSGKNRGADAVSYNKSVFHQKYDSFKRLLSANDQCLRIISDLEQILYNDKPFTLAYLLNQTEILLGEVLLIIDDLNEMSEGKYKNLPAIAGKISEKILGQLNCQNKIEETDFVMPLERISLENSNDVGGKAANLGEIYNRVNLPVPQGFAVTAYACQYFLEQNRLSELIDEKIRNIDVNDTEKLMAVSQEIKDRIMEEKLPVGLEKSIIKAAINLKEKIGEGLRFSMRSSATSEDSEASFAGQHSTVLNVDEKNLINAYKKVVASTFNPRAIFYRRRKGYRDQDVVMSVACVMMLDAKVSGVMYTVDPKNSRNAVVIISAVWGLAVGVVDGSINTDFFQINKTSGKVEVSETAVKKTLLRPDTINGIMEESVQDDMKNILCLNQKQIKTLFHYGLTLEDHYGYALDIEWVIDQNDKLYILQARPLRKSQKYGAAEIEVKTGPDIKESVSGFPVLLEGGASAYDGTATGLSYILESEHNMHHVPEGAIVIVRQTSPRYVPLMSRIRAIVTDVGSVTGHMATVAREFHIPALVGTDCATRIIPNGQEITVDSTNRKIYQGRVESLLKNKKPYNPMKGSPIYKTAQLALKSISPLNLTDPKEDNFSSEGCHTVHDIIRFAHEKAMQNMFRISDDLNPEKNISIPLRVYLPLNIYVIDLGEGLLIDPDAKEAKENNLTCVPLKALLKGMKHEGVDWTNDVGVSWGGFASIMAESVLRDPLKEGRMGAPNYAIISGQYLNFNSRLGYHFATVDTYCGQHVNDNYIIFSFKGGAADIGRRSRRALLIAMVLKKLGFRVERNGDMVKGELKKYLSHVLEDKLDMLGRLLGSVRLLDMVLADDGRVEWYVDQFFKENYTFKPDRN